MTAAERQPEFDVPRRPRRDYLDWLRGVAVLIMIESHVIDSWTAAPDRGSRAFAWALILGGFGAPLFLLLAGVSSVLSAGSKARRVGDAAAAAAVARRGFQIFLLAFAFRLQAWILGWAKPWTLLRVDILNIMGPAIVAAACLWALGRSPRRRALVFAAATIAVAAITPPIRIVPWLAVLPDALEAYIRPAGGFSGFTLFPWVGFLFGGALLGVFLESAGTPGKTSALPWTTTERGLNVAFATLGALAAGAAFAASYFPTPYLRSDFWTTSPSFFFLRLGLLTTAVGVAYAWERRPGAGQKWSPLRQLGRTSLFVYWIHVEIVYGLLSLPLHHALTFGQAVFALVAFSALMLACSVAKDHVVESRNMRRANIRPAKTAGAT